MEVVAAVPGPAGIALMLALPAPSMPRAASRESTPAAPAPNTLILRFAPAREVPRRRLVFGCATGFVFSAVFGGPGG